MELSDALYGIDIVPMGKVSLKNIGSAISRAYRAADKAVANALGIEQVDPKQQMRNFLALQGLTEAQYNTLSKEDQAVFIESFMKYSIGGLMAIDEANRKKMNKTVLAIAATVVTAGVASGSIAIPAGALAAFNTFQGAHDLLDPRRDQNNPNNSSPDNPTTQANDNLQTAGFNNLMMIGPAALVLGGIILTPKKKDDIKGQY
jgi:hypothetical protein